MGSSAAKIGLFAPDGRLLALHRCGYRTQEPRTGFKEQHPADWWRAACEGIRSVLALGPGGHVAAVAAIGHISSCTFVDGQGEVLRPAIGFQDQRATAESREIQATISRAEMAAHLGIDLPPAPNWPLPKLLWLRKHEPHTLDRARYVLQAKDFINLRLTGVFATDLSSSRGLVDFRAGKPARALFAQFGLPELLPPLREPGEIVGQITAAAAEETGLPRGCPVLAGWNDLNACALGSGMLLAGQTFNVTGTSEHIGMVVDHANAPPGLVSAPYLRGRRLLYGVTSSGGGALHWFSQLCSAGVPQLIEECSIAPAALLFLPYLEGERSPVWDPQASGLLLGLRTEHNRGHIARAILEGVAFSLRQNLDLLGAAEEPIRGPIVLSGGGSTLPLWNSIKADVFKRDVVTLRNPQAGVQGAVILASVATGFYRDVETATRTMTHTAESTSPSTLASGRLQRLYGIFTQLYPAVRSLSHALAANHGMEQPADGLSATAGQEV